MRKAIGYIMDANSLLGRMLCITVYILTYDFMFEHFVFKLFYYMGLDYIEMEPLPKTLWITFSILPFTLYKGIKSMSSYFCIFLYLLVYIPFIHALFVTNGIDAYSLYSYACVMCLFFIVYFGMESWRNLFKPLELRPALSFRWIEIITLIITAIFVLSRMKSMHFVNIFTQSDVLYDLRSQNSEAINGGGGFIAYLQGWLSGAFYPFLLVCYLREKKWLKALAILFGYILLFMVDMQKITFVMPFVLVALYFVVQLKHETISQRLHSLIIVTTVIISFALYFAQDNEILFVVGAIVLLRTVCVAGWLSQFYLHFFSEHPYTHYSHINIVNALTNGYPYDVPLGVAVAHGTQNANANFFLTDGIAAWGLLGIVIIGLFFLLLLQFINAIAYRYDTKDLFVMFLPPLSYLLNASVFTTLLSNGLFILLFMLLIVNGPLVKVPATTRIIRDDKLH